jgi:hypothetical protein
MTTFLCNDLKYTHLFAFLGDVCRVWIEHGAGVYAPIRLGKID